MRTALLGVVAALLCNCQWARTGTTGGRGAGAQISGRIRIPGDYRDTPDTFCSGLAITTTAAGTPVGRATIQTGDTDCLYDIKGVPLNTQLAVSVERAGVLVCVGGNLVVLRPFSSDVTVHRGEERTLDFDGRCGDQAG